jgi:diacylglycerol kinase (ATP)
MSYLIAQARRIGRAFWYSAAGLQAAWREEAAFLQWSVLAALLVPLGLWLGEGGVEKALLVSAVLACPVAELINSAIEAVVDRISDERHDLSKKAKDIGSAVVLVTAGGAVLVWVLVLGW